MKGPGILLLSIIALGSSACGPGRRKLVLPPVPQVVAKPMPQPEIETPPEIETAIPVLETPLEELPPEPPIENPPKPVQKRRPQPAQTPASQTTPEVPATPTPVAPPTPAPVLGEILTDDRRREYEAEFDGRLTRARAAVSRASGRRLTGTQKETVVRIRVFLQQAEESKEKDLMTALQLARRADLLGQDLLKSLR